MVYRNVDRVWWMSERVSGWQHSMTGSTGTRMDCNAMQGKVQSSRQIN